MGTVMWRILNSQTGSLKYKSAEHYVSDIDSNKTLCGKAIPNEKSDGTVDVDWGGPVTCESCIAYEEAQYRNANQYNDIDTVIADLGSTGTINVHEAVEHVPNRKIKTIRLRLTATGWMQIRNGNVYKKEIKRKHQ